VAELLAVAFLGGLITGLSPCIVPVLPVVVAGGTTAGSRWRPFLIIAGLVLSFSLTELVGSTVLSALGLPQDFLFWLGVSFLFILAVGLLVPTIGDWIERPFNRLGTSRYARRGGGLVLGISLGLVFVPCAGPVLAAISVAAANHRVGASSLLVTLFYAIGATVPLLVLAILAQRTANGWKGMRAHLPAIRRGAGALLGVTALAIAFGWLNPLQRSVPGYTSALENHIESGSSITKQLQALDGEHPNQFVKAAAVKAKSTTTSTTAKAAPAPPKAAKTANLPDLGRAPEFTGVVTWLNTPNNAPLTLQQLRGKVVLIDFWTYSCINCQRSLPHVEAWYRDYKDDGLVVIGVHTPEFAFEHVVGNVKSAAASLGVKYPIAVDSNYGTWDAWGNQYWPAEYLVDPSGNVRAYSFGEGDYSTMEGNIRALLQANGATTLPPATDVANKTPTAQLSPESYLGYSEIQYDVGTPIAKDRPTTYRRPSHLPTDKFAFDGTWTDHNEDATAGSNAAIDINFTAHNVYLVIGGQGTVTVALNGKPYKTLAVGGIPKLYTLFSGPSSTNGVLALRFSPGLNAYDFTFG
jgi:cytochrome c biogenesis protein CcdA/thiol-disulfide isomerase/thioredoxin